MVRVGCCSVQLIDRVSGKPLPEVTHDGTHFALATPDSEFAVAVRNHSGRNAQSSLFVDGDKVDMCFNHSSDKASS